MKRRLMEDLILWKESDSHLPLLVRGARQVGKTHLIETFGRSHFEECVVINFERDARYKACFNELDPHKILMSLELISGKKILPGRTLLFLDEIQECPNAIQGLRYFKEEFPALHVIGAGSLLEFVLRKSDFSMPVGRVQFLYLKPLSFSEFLEASGKILLNDYLKSTSLAQPIPEAVHQELLAQVRLYLILGGMPAVLTRYFESGIQEARAIQLALLQTYRSDFGKYSRQQDFSLLETLFIKLPAFVSQHIKYSKLEADLPSRDVKSALEKLNLAGLITQVFSTSASGLPLAAHKNDRKFKALFVDVGLMLRSCQVDPQLLVQEDVLFLLQGSMMEQFVGQELLAYQDPHEFPELFFWERDEKNRQAEVDYVSVAQNMIVPIEVKSKSLGHLKSLKRFMAEKNTSLGLRVSEHPLSFENQILSVPLYMIREIPRLLSHL
ncbi:MAG: DUF4143 domain-containing protein [Gammaproteobacteria bacterium]|nr:DUF4143 domain-containing protein [Gammaproteobacteria bacterium]